MLYSGYKNTGKKSLEQPNFIEINLILETNICTNFKKLSFKLNGIFMQMQIQQPNYYYYRLNLLIKINEIHWMDIRWIKIPLKIACVVHNNKIGGHWTRKYTERMTVYFLYPFLTWYIRFLNKISMGRFVFCIILCFSHVKWSFTFPKDTKYQLNANMNACDKLSSFVSLEWTLWITHFWQNNSIPIVWIRHGNKYSCHLVCS